MYVKFLPEDLNLDFCPSHLTSIYTYGITTTPRMCGGAMLSDEAVNLTSEMHDPCAQESPTHKKKTRTPCRRHRCGAGQIPSEGLVRNILTTLEC